MPCKCPQGGRGEPDIRLVDVLRLSDEGRGVSGTLYAGSPLTIDPGGVVDEGTDQKLYYFSVQDKDADALTFACVAQSLEHAKRKAMFCEHRELLLLEVRPLAGIELPEVARALALANPLVGKDWLPLVDLMAANLSLHRAGHTWVVDVFDHRDPLSESNPYAQAVLDPDGSWRLEVGPTSLLLESSEDNGGLAELLEWSPPLDSWMPNYFRVVPPGYSIEYVAATAIQALTVLFGVTTRDGFSLSRPSPKDVAGIESIDPGPDYELSFPVFGLTGLHQVRIPRLVERDEG